MKKKEQKQRRLWRVPWFILLICFVQIALHFVANACLQKLLIYQPESEYWRYFTYMLLHADTCHLSLNICLQLFVGCCLELEQGHCRLSLIYLLGGLCGSLAHSWLQPELLLLGGSAGVYAMMSSHIPHLVLNFHHLSYRYARILSLMILFSTDMGLTIYHFHYHLNRNPRISLEAHLGGGISGLLGGFVIYRRVASLKTYF
ncbi:uncharacterized protein Dwil_GK14633 [Drosophila willistoni]|uniref:Peptidase S54 rhomboid domain-containing protein n=2 Tax=Drosophila willistoni TaxID=7260 RepID=B4MVE5_DROWI|nr:uncharacterized protein Dwil_GK14633 [Drosophila willistoni]